jgi:hypothetical protein
MKAQRYNPPTYSGEQYCHGPLPRAMEMIEKCRECVPKSKHVGLYCKHGHDNARCSDSEQLHDRLMANKMTLQRSGKPTKKQ